MLKRVNLKPEMIQAGLPGWLVTEINSFEPLDFPAGKGAANWLRDYISDPCGPWKVVLTCDEDWRLLGFFALAYKQIALPPDPAEVPAMEVAWIARGAETEKGFGHQLLTYAVALALEAGAAAFVVSPNDKTTARKVWLGRFLFRLIEPEDPNEEETMQVFLSLQEPPPGETGPA